MIYIIRIILLYKQSENEKVTIIYIQNYSYLSEVLFK